MSAVPSQSRLAVRFFAVSLTALLAAAVLARGLVRLWPATSFPQATFPPVFAFSTAALLAGSAFLSQAVAAVRRERQPRFRWMLVLALMTGTVFVAAQTVALNWLLRRQVPEDVPTDAVPYVAVAAALHGLHFAVALLFLAFVTVRAFADRYDHEYFWGVTVCTWFWHALGAIWLVVLAVMAIVR